MHFCTDLPEAWTHHNEGENTWNAFEVVGHLIDCERTNWIPRAKIILNSGENQPFTPFDRGGHVRRDAGQPSAWPSCWTNLPDCGRENLEELRAWNLPQPDDLAKRGRHPAFGAVSLSELLATWAAHDLTPSAPGLQNHGPSIPRDGGSVEPNILV